MKFIGYIAIFLMHLVLQADEYIVSSLADSGTNTLRDAMLAVVDDDVITFDSSLSGTISLASSLPTITAENLSIVGPASLAVAIEASSLYQIFNIQADSAKIKNLILRNGASATFGGAVFVAANLSAYLTNLSIHACSGSNCQDPIYIDDSGFANIINPAFVAGSGADIFFVNSSAIIQNTNTLTTPTMLIDGSGVIETKGPGGVSLVAFSNPIALVIYNQSGTCTFSGNTSSILIANGTINGTFTTGYIGNTGVIQPGNGGTGSITSTTNYDQAADGNLEIKITASGTSDTVSVSGNFYPEGVLTILPQSGSYTVGTSYTIVTSALINNTYPSVICPITGFPFAVVYHADSIEIVITNNVSI